MDFKSIIRCIQQDAENRASHELPNWVGNDIFEYFGWNPKWRIINGQPGYLIGLCEDRWDYYWIYINNKEAKLRFMTCCYNVSEICENVTKKWSKEEKRHVSKVVEEYFNEHKDEKLLYYVWENINNG